MSQNSTGSKVVSTGTDSETRGSVGVWLRLMRCARPIERAMSRQLRRRYGQSMSRFDVLSQLDRAPDHSLSVGELSRQLLASDGNISRLLDRMAGEALLTRRPSPHDRRSQRVTITEKGRALFSEMANSHAQWVHQLIGELSSAQQVELQHLLDQLRDLVEERRE